MIKLNKKRIYIFYLKVFISCLIFILVNYLYSTNYYKNIDHILFNSQIDFSYFRSKTNKLLKNIISKKTAYISSEKLEYKNILKYHDGYKIMTDENYIIKNLKSGVVTFIGFKEDLGKTIIIESDDGVNIWYSNLENISVNIYDYIDKDVILGSTIKDYFYLTIMKDNEYLNYEEYL